MMDSLENMTGIQYLKLFSKAIFTAVLLSLIMILILSIVVSTTSLKESMISPIVIFISAISILIGGLMISKKVKKNGIILGTLVGIAYMLILYLTSSFMNMNFSLDSHAIIMIIFGMIGGAIGGILGVNL